MKIVVLATNNCMISAVYGLLDVFFAANFCIEKRYGKGVIKEIDGVIDQYKHQYSDLTVILTGGDAKFLSNQLKNSIFANSNFLLEGLNFMLLYNSK